MLGCIGYFRGYFGRPQKSKELSIEISPFYRKHHKKSLLNFPLPGTDKRQSFQSSQTSLQITIQNVKKSIYFYKSSAQLPLCPVGSICVEKLFVFSTKVSTFLRRPQTMSFSSRKTFPSFHLVSFIKQNFCRQLLEDFWPKLCVVALTYSSLLDCMDHPGLTQYTG